jgi:hypothetical protein
MYFQIQDQTNHAQIHQDLLIFYYFNNHNHKYFS